MEHIYGDILDNFEYYNNFNQIDHFYTFIREELKLFVEDAESSQFEIVRLTIHAFRSTLSCPRAELCPECCI